MRRETITHNTYKVSPGKGSNIPPAAGALLLALANLSGILQEISQDPAVRIDAYAWQEDPEAGVLLLDVFRGGKKKTIRFSEEELMDGTRAGRNGLREKLEEIILGRGN